MTRLLLATSVALVFVFLFPGCKSLDVTIASTAQSLAVSHKLVHDAKGLIGSPYRYGGRGPTHFDCSGLVEFVCKLNRVELAGSSSQMAKQSQPLAGANIRTGDLVFFTHQGRVNHVAFISKIKRGEIWIVHSTSSKGVIEQNLSTSQYWTGRIHSFRSIDHLL